MSTNFAWGGLGEILLFMYIYRIQVVCLRWMISGVQAVSSFGLFDMLDKKQRGDMDISSVPFSNCIFLWSLDPAQPNEPMAPDGDAKHYVLLEPLIEQEDNGKADDVLYFFPKSTDSTTP